MMKRDIRNQVSAIKMEEEDQRTNSNCEAVAAIVYLCEFWHHGLSHVKAIIALLLVTLSCHEIFDRWTFLSLSFFTKHNAMVRSLHAQGFICLIGCTRTIFIMVVLVFCIVLISI
jgi:hypothetical protein